MKIYKYLFIAITMFSLNADALVVNEPLIGVKTQKLFEQLPIVSVSAYDYLERHPVKEETARYIFVRHGESTSNKEKGYAGRTKDVDLTEKGLDQAVQVGKQLEAAGVRIHSVYTSPMIRTNRTAKAILSQLTSQPKEESIIDARLLERWYGRCETDTEFYINSTPLEKKEISQLATFSEKFEYKLEPDMESMSEVYDRVQDFIAKTHASNLGKTVLVAAHNGIVKALTMAESAINGYDLEYFSYLTGNCCVVVVEVDANGQSKVVATNGLSWR